MMELITMIDCFFKLCVAIFIFLYLPERRKRRYLINFQQRLTPTTSGEVDRPKESFYCMESYVMQERQYR